MINSKTKDALIKFLFDHRRDTSTYEVSSSFGLQEPGEHECDGISIEEVKSNKFDRLEPQEVELLLEDFQEKKLISINEQQGILQIKASLYDYLNRTFEQRESIENLNLEMLYGNLLKLKRELEPDIWQKIQPIIGCTL
jgi:hypothetical protein